MPQLPSDKPLIEPARQRPAGTTWADAVPGRSTQTPLRSAAQAARCLDWHGHGGTGPASVMPACRATMTMSGGSRKRRHAA